MIPKVEPDHGSSDCHNHSVRLARFTVTKIWGSGSLKEYHLCIDCTAKELRSAEDWHKLFEVKNE